MSTPPTSLAGDDAGLTDAAVRLFERAVAPGADLTARYTALQDEVLRIPDPWRAPAVLLALAALGAHLRAVEDAAAPAPDPDPSRVNLDLRPHNSTLVPPPGLAESRCKACGTAIYWVKHVDTGRLAPIEAQPRPLGNIVVANGLYRILARPQDPDPAGPRYANHFVACPQAAQFGRRPPP